MKRYVNIAVVVGLLLFLYSFINFSLNQLWGWVSTVSLILGVLIGGIGIYYRIQLRRKEFSRRTLKYGTGSILSVVIVLGIIVLLAFITNRHNARADLTQKGLHSLAEQTKSVLNDLEKEVQVTAFYKESDEWQPKSIFEDYAHHTSNFNFEFIDPNEKPQIARKYNVSQYKTVIVESGNKRETIDDLTESNLTNAIIKVTRELDKVIYFTTGHGEREIDNDGPKGFQRAAEGIRKENYQVETLNLAQQKSIPEDCSVLVIAGPKADFFDFELDTIAGYLEDGGKLMALIDPQWKPKLVNFLKDYDVDVGDNIIVDASGVGQLFGMGPEVPLVSNYEDHEIFEEFNVMTFYPMACSVEKGSGGDAGFTTEVLFKSSPSSWAEADYMDRNVEFNEDKDKKGPIPLALTSSKTFEANKKAQLLVIGDSDFAVNSYIQNSGNYDLFLNEINWLAEEEDKITVRAKEWDDRRVNLTAKDSKVVLYVSVIALPLIVVIAGVFIYFRRR